MKIDLAKNKFFCLMPWSHFYTSLSGKVFPCCNSNVGNNLPFTWYEGQSAEEILNADKFKQFRLDLMAGRSRPDVCSSCYEEDEFGYSKRQKYNEIYSSYISDFVENTNLDGSLKKTKILYLDLRFTNLCNFKCRSCNSSSSSSIGLEEGIPFNEKLFFENEKIDLALSKIDEVKEIYFAGGEPLLHKSQFLILDNLIKRGATQIGLVYNTNLSILKKDQFNLLDLWGNFSSIKLIVSVDEIFDRASYVRSGTNWEVVESNIDLIRRNNKKIKFYFNITISVLNALRIADIIDYLFSKNLAIGDDEINLNILNEPQELSLNNLSINARKESLQKFNRLEERFPQKFENNIKYKELFKYLMTTECDSNPTQTIKFLQKKDLIRNEDFKKILPDVAADLNY